MNKNISLQNNSSLVNVDGIDLELGEVDSSDGDNLSNDLFTIDECL